MKSHKTDSREGEKRQNYLIPDTHGVSCMRMI